MSRSAGSADHEQVLLYEKWIKQMPLLVLKQFLTVELEANSGDFDAEITGTCHQRISEILPQCVTADFT